MFFEGQFDKYIYIGTEKRNESCKIRVRVGQCHCAPKPHVRIHHHQRPPFFFLLFWTQFIIPMFIITSAPEIIIDSKQSWKWVKSSSYIFLIHFFFIYTGNSLRRMLHTHKQRVQNPRVFISHRHCKTGLEARCKRRLHVYCFYTL